MRFSLYAHAERFADETPWDQLYDELVELVQIAEAGGFRAFWVGEHYGMTFAAAPNPLTFLAHIAARTKTITIGSSGDVHPFALAAATAREG